MRGPVNLSITIQGGRGILYWVLLLSLLAGLMVGWLVSWLVGWLRGVNNCQWRGAGAGCQKTVQVGQVACKMKDRPR